MNMTHPDILEVERIGMSEEAEWFDSCPSCNRKRRKDDCWECSQCKKQICPNCTYVTDDLRERFCEDITDQGCDPPLYQVSECLELWYAKKLAEAEGKVYDQGVLITKLQTDLNERLI